MLDFSHVPNAQNGADIQIFRACGQQFDWKTWVKPRGKSHIYMFVVGGGAGGAGGCTGAAGTTRGGGGGGGSSGFASLVMPAFSVPDICYVAVGTGGLGGAAGANGGDGLLSLIARYPQNVPETTMLAAHSSNPSSGNGGTSSGGGVGAPAATLVGRSIYSGPCLSFMSNAGGAGWAGGSQNGAIGTPATLSQWTTGGLGGAGVGTSNTDFAGGSLAGDGMFIPSPVGGVAGGGAGVNGFEITANGFWIPLGLPGTGGGSNGAFGVGGSGGNGTLGCGGGGGGAGVTGGAGGRGGDGLVVIACW